MARYSGASWRPLPGRSGRSSMTAHNILCFHTMVGSLAGSEAYFADSDVDSHFGVGNTTDGVNDGAVWQWLDTAKQSHANLNGNPDVVSVETSDGGDPARPWSPEAVDALVDLGVWVCKTHDIPPRLINGNEPGSRGIAYHRQGCDKYGGGSGSWPYDQWRVSGGVKWSNSVGKTCPGDVRIKQLVDIVIPRIKAGVEGDWFDMATKAELIQAIDDSWTHKHVVDIKAAVSETLGSTGKTPRQGWATSFNIETIVADLAAKVNWLVEQEQARQEAQS